MSYLRVCLLKNYINYDTKQLQFYWDLPWPLRTSHHPWWSSSFWAFRGRRTLGTRSQAHQVPLKVFGSSSTWDQERSSPRCCRLCLGWNSGRRVWRRPCERKASGEARRILLGGSWCRLTCGSLHQLRCHWGIVMPVKKEIRFSLIWKNK